MNRFFNSLIKKRGPYYFKQFTANKRYISVSSVSFRLYHTSLKKLNNKKIENKADKSKESVGTFFTAADRYQRIMYKTMKKHRLLQLQFIIGIIACFITTMYVFSEKLISLASKQTTEVVNETLTDETFQKSTARLVDEIITNKETQAKLVSVIVNALKSKPVIDTTKVLVTDVLNDKDIQNKVKNLLGEVINDEHIQKKLTNALIVSSVDALNSKEVYDSTLKTVEALLLDQSLQDTSSKHAKAAVGKALKFWK